LVEAASKGEAPIIDVRFSLALALPFMLSPCSQDVEFPTKSGGWLNTVKVVLGFLELALALQILVKCGLSATIAFAGKRSVFGYLIAILEH
jgi:thiol:disulfide interchange protein DsbD